MAAPLIGITTGGRSERYVRSQHYAEFYSVPVQYVDALRRAGGVPLLLPPGDDWAAALPILDGLIVTGGTDIDPAEYGGDCQHPALLPVDCERDRSELALARRLLDERELPMLCICRGLQTLNVAAGGSLHEHIPDLQPNDIHRDNGMWAHQAVQVEPDSLLARVIGAVDFHSASGHHQAVKRLGAGMRAVAVAADGIIEAIEMPAYPNLVAVQWHPEVTAAQDPQQQALFDWLVEAAMSRQSVKI